MKRPKLRPRLTYANVIATLALFVALGGGAYAAAVLPANSVGTRQLRDEAVTGAKVRDGSLLGADFAAGELPSGPRGERGLVGPRGEAGEKGARGPAGETGAEGERGAPGPEGKAGADGSVGPRGPVGPAGEPGADGNAGPRGERGAPGPEGAAGEPGPRGERGLRGERGAAGERGPAGEAGEPGSEGPQGESGTVRTVVRYGETATVDPRPFASFATCRKGEWPTGGGFDLLRSRELVDFQVRADRASNSETISEQEAKERIEREELGEEGEVFGSDEAGNFFVYRDPRDGTAATGWAVSLSTTGKEPETRLQYRAYVVCATSARLVG